MTMHECLVRVMPSMLVPATRSGCLLTTAIERLRGTVEIERHLAAQV